MKGNLKISCAALVAVMATSASAFTIDNFSNGNSFIGLSSGTQSANTAASSALGGYRYTDLVVDDNLYGLNASNAVQGGAYTLNTDAGVYAHSYLGYGYGPNGTPTDLNFNMAAQGNAMQFTFAQIDPYLNFNVVVFTDTTYAAYGINLGSETGPYTLTAPLSSFGHNGPLTPDFSHVTDIYIEFNQSSGVVYGADIALTNISVVPEPAPYAALGLGLIPLALRRRSKK